MSNRTPSAEEYLVLPLVTSMDASLVHSANVRLPMDSTEAGMVTVPRYEQYWNVNSPMLLMPSERVMPVNFSPLRNHGVLRPVDDVYSCPLPVPAVRVKVPMLTHPPKAGFCSETA